MDTFTQRIPISWRSPSYRRSQTIRKLLAGALFLLAGVLLIAERTTTTHSYVVVKAELSPGTVITSEHIERRSLPVDVGVTAPLADAEAAIGRVVAAPLKSGDFVQEHHLLGPELGQALGAESLVPVKLSDPAAAELAIPGAVVSVVAARSDTETSTIAEGARVVFATERKTDSTEAGTVLLAMDATSAARVAAASLGMPLTVILTPKV
ncbi:SAF domain-containing protein [Corynebacterium sp. H130]|uniref:SAF domain-containing protein n=1 Tax=Corynebacterium sp. H130 TaxID=3133444 RepID=UPI0030B62BE7